MAVEAGCVIIRQYLGLNFASLKTVYPILFPGTSFLSCAHFCRFPGVATSLNKPTRTSNYKRSIMSNVASLLPIIRGEISKLRIPQAADKVYKDECVLSFDSPFSDTGLYVNMATWRGYGRDYLDLDIKSTGCKLYLHEVWHQIEKKPEEGAPQSAPVKLAIGVDGGFSVGTQYDIVKENFLVVVNGPNLESIPLPCTDLPEYVSNVAQAIINHEGMKSNLQIQSWDADNEKFVSRYAATLEQVNPTGKKIPQDPKQWRDEATGDTENLWLNLSTGYIGGGRKNWDGTGGSGSALAHYEATGRKYPLVVKLGTITPHGADIYSYAPEEDGMVLDPNLAEHLSFWGIDVMKMEKTAKTMGELDVALNMSYDWTRMVDAGEELELVTGAGLVGLRNIGSSCYLNSVMQTILAIPEVGLCA
jgi:ubiquitin carboxyl-terminal hydrolase 5/13